MFKESFKIFYFLILKDLRVLFKTFKDSLINNIIFVFFQVLLYEKMFSLMGFPIEKTFPIVVGGIANVLFIIAYSKALENVFDLEFHKFITYKIILPISINWLLVKYLLSSYTVIFSSSNKHEF